MHLQLKLQHDTFSVVDNLTLSSWRKLPALWVALFLVGCCDHEGINKNIQALSSNTAKIRNDAALSLARCGTDAEEAVPILGRLIYDQNVGVQSAAAYALRQIDTKEARLILERATNARRRK